MARGYASIGLRAFLITFLILIGIGCVAAGVTYSMELWGGKTIPNVVGMTQEDAENILQELGFSTEVESVASDEDKGTVLGTDPESGVRADEHSMIIVYVAKPKSVPNVLGMMLEEAEAVLSDNGYTNIEVIEKASDEEKGKVLSQEPNAKTKAKSDTLISLTVATPHIVPEVVGMSEAEAKSALTNAGYKYYVTSSYSEDVPEGTVVETVPPAGEPLSSTETVEVKVAKSRSSELIEVARRYFESLSRISVNGRSYEISQIDDVQYENGSTCRFTLTVRPFESHSWFGGEPEVRYGNYEKLDGSILMNDKNEVVSTNPPITMLQ